MQFPPFLHKKQGTTIIPGAFFRALVWGDEQYVYEHLRVYADRTIAGVYLLKNLPHLRAYKHIKMYIPNIRRDSVSGLMGLASDENMNAIPYEDFKHLVNKNLVTLKYEGLAKVEFLGDPITDEDYMINIDTKISGKELLLSIEDIFNDLNNKPTSLRKCMNALCEFLLSPMEKKEVYRKALHKAYLSVPDYQRSDIFPLTIDLEGRSPIEDIIYMKDGRLDQYDIFVRVYGDDYFEAEFKARSLS